jgi:hypothetical protein
VADRGGVTVKRSMARVKKIAVSPQAKSLGQELAQKAQDPERG